MVAYCRSNLSAPVTKAEDFIAAKKENARLSAGKIENFIGLINIKKCDPTVDEWHREINPNSKLTSRWRGERTGRLAEQDKEVTSLIITVDHDIIDSQVMGIGMTPIARIKLGIKRRLG